MRKIDDIFIREMWSKIKDLLPDSTVIINIRDNSTIEIWKGTVEQYNQLTPDEQQKTGVIHFIEEREGV